MKPLLIGEAPSKNEPIPRPLEGRIGRRLAQYAGVTFEEYLELFDRVNLLDVRQDTKEKGFTFDTRKARKRARHLLEVSHSYRTFILLGRRVAGVFDMGHLPNFKRYESPVGVFYVMPHPSGVNRWWNFTDNQIEATKFMRELVRMARDGS